MSRRGCCYKERICRNPFFVEFFSFNKIGENHKEKELVRKVTVVVALGLGCENIKNSEYENE